MNILDRVTKIHYLEVSEMELQDIPLTLTKLDVAKRQLREAIWLLFHERDAVAIHTLTAAAHEVLHDLGQRRGLESIRNSSYIREDKKALWKKAVNDPQNFFKHANTDPEASLAFHPELPRFLLLDALVLYETLTQQALFVEGSLYMKWCTAKYPETMNESIWNSPLAPPINIGFNPDDFQQMRFLLDNLSDN